MPEPGKNADACQAARETGARPAEGARMDRYLPFKELTIGTQRPGS